MLDGWYGGLEEGDLRIECRGCYGDGGTTLCALRRVSDDSGSR